MRNQPKNTPASIHAQLANAARKQGRPFAEMLQYYGMERFLYRLSKTRHAKKFVLKGGLVFHVLNIPLRRPTKDIDFLGYLDNSTETIRQAINDVFSVPAPEDGVKFEAATLVLEKTQVDADRQGIRAKFLGYLGRAEIPMQIDIGFSDELTSEAEITNYPTLLGDMTSPPLWRYPVESIVAEKFHAMDRFAPLPSRWKDYYDIWLISNHFDLDDRPLQQAIARTFVNRATSIPSGRPRSLTVDFATRHRRNWSAFLEKSDLKNAEINDLLQVVEKIWAFLDWPLKGLVASETIRNPRRWSPRKRKWG